MRGINTPSSHQPVVQQDRRWSRRIQPNNAAVFLRSAQAGPHPHLSYRLGANREGIPRCQHEPWDAASKVTPGKHPATLQS